MCIVGVYVQGMGWCQVLQAGLYALIFVVPRRQGALASPHHPHELPGFSNPCPGKPPCQAHFPARTPGGAVTGSVVCVGGGRLQVLLASCIWTTTAALRPTHSPFLSFPACLTCTALPPSSAMGQAVAPMEGTPCPLGVLSGRKQLGRGRGSPLATAAAWPLGTGQRKPGKLHPPFTLPSCISLSTPHPQHTCASPAEMPQDTQGSMRASTPRWIE